MTHWRPHWANHQKHLSPPNDKNTTTKIEHTDPPVMTDATGRNLTTKRSEQNALLDQKNLTTEEAAQYLQLSRRTLERYRCQGGGPVFRKAGPGLRARVRYKLADLDAWLNAETYASTSEYKLR